MASYFSLEDFLQKSDQFRLGTITTEQVHPKTKELSVLVKSDLKKAINTLKEVDLDALRSLVTKVPEIVLLKKDIDTCLSSSGRIFLAGCGATGRLSLSLEFLWRSVHKNSNQVVGVMAGGDAALVKAIENFEDHPQYAERQLQDLNFNENDLMIGITEGGETPFVIGATNYALKNSKYNPYFIYCNPDKDLMFIERSRDVIENKKIKKMNLTVGPMAISGSTRMQATTVQQLAVGLALFEEEKDLKKNLENLIQAFEKHDVSFLEDLINWESNIYLNKKFVTYSTDELGITLLTDTTERSPTFSLPTFENKYDQNIIPSYCYLHILNTANESEAWSKILLREPRTLEWEGVGKIAGRQNLSGFDFSIKGKSWRSNHAANSKELKVLDGENELTFCFDDQTRKLNLEGVRGILMKHIFLKLHVNILSTLVMGKLERYLGNIMTWVKPSNYKLIDRSIRYIQILLLEKGIKPSYEEIATEIFSIIQHGFTNEPIVLKVADLFLKKNNKATEYFGFKE